MSSEQRWAVSTRENADAGGRTDSDCLRSASRLLCAASYLLIATAMLHIMAHFAGPPAPVNPEQQLVTELSRTVEFDAGGVRRTLWMILSGYSLFFALALVMHGAFNLMLLRYVRQDVLALRAVGWIGALSMFGYVVISAWYFPLAPAVLFGLCLLLFAAALRECMRAG